MQQAAGSLAGAGEGAWESACQCGAELGPQGQGIGQMPFMSVSLAPEVASLHPGVEDR